MLAGESVSFSFPLFVLGCELLKSSDWFFWDLFIMMIDITALTIKPCMHNFCFLSTLLCNVFDTIPKSGYMTLAVYTGDLRQGKDQNKESLNPSKSCVLVEAVAGPFCNH